MKYLGLELYKLKRRKVFLTFALILGVELLFVCSNYGNNENFLGMISEDRKSTRLNSSHRL